MNRRLLLLLMCCAPQAAFAQDTAGPSVAAAEPQSETTAPSQPTEAAASPDSSADNEARLAALRAAVDELKAKAEEAELAALMAAETAAPVVEEVQPIRVYGFMDFGMDKFFFSEGDKGDDSLALLRPTPTNTFVFGNLNLYFDANPLPQLRALVELRFTVAPHGEEISLGPPLGTSYERTDTLAFDFSAPSAQTQLRLGSVFIERAWSQYEISELVKIQWGMFLNPFGIWNIDHGSPTLISLMLPTFIAAQMVPTRLLGINVHGSTYFGSTEVGYAVHVTNGRTPTDYDMTEDKAIGARLYVAHEGDFGRLALGASGYIGTYDDLQKVIVGQPDNTFDWVPIVAYSEQVVGFDASLDVGDLRLRSEAVMRWIEYDGNRSERIFTIDGSERYLPSRLEYAGYVMAAYRTPWKLEPYVELEVSSKSYVLPRYAGKSRATESDVAAVVPSFGLNVEITPQLLLKSQVALIRIMDVDYEEVFFETPVVFIRAVSSF